jgi:hypothetical protein
VQLSAVVLSLNAFVPLTEQVEAILVGDIVDKHYLVCLMQQVEGDLLEDVLTSDVEQVQLHL